MATAVEVTRPQMHEVLARQNFVEINLPGTKERVYSRFVDRGLCQRVYTSIVGESSRGVGEDAIRVVLVTKLANGEVKIVGADRRVHRVAGWRDNLQQRLDGWREQVGPACPACGCPTVLKKTKRPFWGCCRYPVCKTYQDATPRPVQPSREPAPRHQDGFDQHREERAMSEAVGRAESEWDRRVADKAAYAAAERDQEARAYLAEMEAELAAAGVIDSDDPPPAEWR